MSAELHCHSLFSVDAHHSPEKVVEAAAQRGVEVMSLTEHNHLGSQERARAEAERRGIDYLYGVEIDAEWRGYNFHVLAFGFDPQDAALQKLVARNHVLYGRRFEVYLKRFPLLGHEIDVERLREAMLERYPGHPDPVLNQWFARDVLVEWGVFADVQAYEAALADIRQRVSAKAFGRFADLKKVCKVVRRAGGVLLLAHVARYCPGDPERQTVLLQRLQHEGLDGFELYHPDNMAEAHFDRLCSEAETSGCLISGGSDCHDFRRDYPNALGVSAVPAALVEPIRDRIRQRRAAPKGLRRFFFGPSPKVEQ